MCFSAGASFAASAALGLIGVATVTKANKTKEFSLAVIPLLFAAQQFTEGLLWLSFTDEPSFVLPLTYVFLFFAFLWWPSYAPIMACILEKNKRKKYILAGLAILGVLVGTYIYSSYLLDPKPAYIFHRCLAYPVNGPLITFFTYLYVFVAIGSGLVSSRMIVKIFSLLLGISALITWIVYDNTFTSVWCFFAALISSMLFFYHKDAKIKKIVTLAYKKQRDKLILYTK